MSVEYDVYHNMMYFLLIWIVRIYMKLLNYYGDEVGELYMYMCIYAVGEFSYMLLATIWWCKHVLKYIGVDLVTNVDESIIS